MKFQEWNKIARLSREVVITEKIDGTNAQVSIFNGYEILPEDSHMGMIDLTLNGDKYVILTGSRTRWISTVQDNMGFARWVKDHAEELLAGLGVGSHYGEWWGQGIQRGYGLKEKKFSLFNVGRWNPENKPSCCEVVPTLYTGMFDTTVISMILSELSVKGSVAAPGFMKPEGIVIYHTAARIMFKKTIEKDETPKSLVSNV